MAKATDKPRVYTKRLAQAGGNSLWLAEDHVMQISGGWNFTETYRRFYFRDIQAITERQTKQGVVTTVTTGGILLLVVAFVALVVGIGSENTPYGLITGLIGFAVVAVPVTVMVAMNGRDVLVRFRTATQEVGISAIASQKVLAKVLAEIGPKILAAQADMDAENLQERTVAKNASLLERSTRRFSSVRSPGKTPRPSTPVKPMAAGRPGGSEGVSPMAADAVAEGWDDAEEPDADASADAAADALAGIPNMGAPAESPAESPDAATDDNDAAGDGDAGRPAL